MVVVVVQGALEICCSDARDAAPWARSIGSAEAARWRADPSVPNCEVLKGPRVGVSLLNF